MAFWGCALKPNVKTNVDKSEGDILHLSQACLHSPKDGKNYVNAEVAGVTYALACLEKGKEEHNGFDLLFNSKQLAFLNNGQSEVHLTGYFEPTDEAAKNLTGKKASETEAKAAAKAVAKAAPEAEAKASPKTDVKATPKTAAAPAKSAEEEDEEDEEEEEDEEDEEEEEEDVKEKPKNPAPAAAKVSPKAEDGKRKSAGGSEPQAKKPKGNPVAKFETSMGKFEAEIFLDRVPITASNFIDLCQTNFYKGIHFHRVIPGFMNQFGCPNARDPKSRKAGTGGPKDGTFKNLKTGKIERRSNGGNIQDENISKDSNVPGTLSMANTGRKNSGGSQFFLNVANNKNLDWFSPGASKHPVFGKITSGMDVVTKISRVKTVNDNPVQPIKMNQITITGL